MKYKIEVTYIAAIEVRKTRVYLDRNRYADDYVGHRFTYVLAEVKTKKWPWSTPVKDCELFTHNSVWNTWRYTDTFVEVRKTMAKSLTACLRGYMAGYGDGKDA